MKNLSMVCLIMLMMVLFALPVFAQNLKDGLIAYWMFNETKGEVASDSSGNGHDGDLLGNFNWVDGHFSKALEFDGASEVNVPYSADLNPDVFTVSLWANVEPGSGGAHRAAISCRDDFPQRGYIIYVESGDTWQYWIGVGAGGVTWNTVQGPAVESGEWTHLAITYSDSKQEFYVNGELAGEGTAKLNLNTANELLIGAGANELDPHLFFFVGMIDDVRLYDRVLTEDEIAKAMESEAAAVDTSDKATTTWGMIKK